MVQSSVFEFDFDPCISDFELLDRREDAESFSTDVPEFPGPEDIVFSEDDQDQFLSLGTPEDTMGDMLSLLNHKEPGFDVFNMDYEFSSPVDNEDLDSIALSLGAVSESSSSTPRDTNRFKKKEAPAQSPTRKRTREGSFSEDRTLASLSKNAGRAVFSDDLENERKAKKPALKPSSTETVSSSATAVGKDTSVLPSDRKIGSYTLEQRRERIQRYLEKRTRRVWRKTIKYDCRQTLAAARPRIKGRFVKRSDVEAEAALASELIMNGPAACQPLPTGPVSLVKTETDASKKLSATVRPTLSKKLPLSSTFISKPSPGRPVNGGRKVAAVVKCTS